MPFHNPKLTQMLYREQKLYNNNDDNDSKEFVLKYTYWT